MNISRIIGNNISLELQKQSIDVADFAYNLGYSLIDVYKLIEGRLYVPPYQLIKIATSLNIAKKQLIECKSVSEYKTLVHTCSNFELDSNQDVILDLIDLYIDLAEAI